MSLKNIIRDMQPDNVVRYVIVGVGALVVLVLFWAVVSAPGEDSLFERHFRVLDLLLSWEIVGSIIAGFVGREGVRAFKDRTTVIREDPGTGRVYEFRGSSRVVREFFDSLP